jgi:hypothetical protein
MFRHHIWYTAKFPKDIKVVSQFLQLSNHLLVVLRGALLCFLVVIGYLILAFRLYTNSISYHVARCPGS